MKTNTIPERVGEQIVRGIAAFVCVLLASAIVLSILSGLPVIAACIAFVLFIDFSLRAGGLAKISVLAMLSRLLQGKLFFFARRAIVLKPKKFAAAIGALLCLAALALWLFRLYTLQYAVLLVLLVFSFLESAFRFCAGCKIFALLVRLGLAREDICEECILPGGEGI
ncbi:MAG: DUF4395 domain-containing protein [Spirochaetes bacterium]|nr:DUF4395 domain-containing protein [Spirochaetota bacterium]MBU0956178.1 DUF4395 domain-containing protein [Spirochaetota bacterium]